MRMRIILAICACTASASAAQDPPDPNGITVTGKKLCKMETRTGSITPRRVCRTLEQVREAERVRALQLETMEEFRRLQDKRILEWGKGSSTD